MGKLVHLTIPIDNSKYHGKDRVLVEHVFNHIKGTIHSGTSDNPTLVMPAVYREELTGIVTISARQVYITSKICGRCNLHPDDPEYKACYSHGVRLVDRARDTYTVIRKLGWLEYHIRKIKSYFHKSM